MTIGQYYSTITNFKMIEDLFHLYDMEQIKLFIKTQTSSNLSNESYGNSTPFNPRSAIPHVRTSYGACLGIIGGLYTKDSLCSDTVLSCEFICSHIINNNFKVYSKLDGIVALFCLKS
ncbi:hypothetical protein [Cetobacterium sp.]|uniref:hypothetical protein n=1 Tax=Cetobacterium sp. TaxID=2071632 RepID=UPI003EE6A8D2